MAGKRDYFHDFRREAAIAALSLSTIALAGLGYLAWLSAAGDEAGLDAATLARAVPVLAVLFAAASTGAVTLLSKDPARGRRFGRLTAWLMAGFLVLLLTIDSLVGLIT